MQPVVFTAIESKEQQAAENATKEHLDLKRLKRKKYMFCVSPVN